MPGCSWRPGCTTAPADPAPTSFDALSPLVNWVETGTAPETILATKFVADTPPAVAMTRPLCVYPKVAKYNGSGSTSMRGELYLRRRRARLQPDPGSEIRAVS